MNTIIFLTPEQVTQAKLSDNSIGMMGIFAVNQWLVNNTDPENPPKLRVATLAYHYKKYGEYGRSVECRQVEKLLRDKITSLVFVSVCNDSVCPNAMLMGWTTPVDIMAKGSVVTIGGLKHYQLPSFLVKPMDEFLKESNHAD